MTEKYEKDAMVNLAVTMGESDDKLFFEVFDRLYNDDLRNAARSEVILALGLAAGTLMRMRARIKELAGQLNGRA